MPGFSLITVTVRTVRTGRVIMTVLTAIYGGNSLAC
jgi:hypothetical protein